MKVVEGEPIVSFLKRFVPAAWNENQTLEEVVASISDGGLVQDRSEILGIGSVVALVRVGGPLVPDCAEEDHAGHLAEQLNEGDDEAHGAHHVESGDQPHLYRGRTSLLVPKLLVATLRI